MALKTTTIELVCFVSYKEKFDRYINVCFGLDLQSLYCIYINYYNYPFTSMPLVMITPFKYQLLHETLGMCSLVFVNKGGNLENHQNYNAAI